MLETSRFQALSDKGINGAVGLASFQAPQLPDLNASLLLLADT